MITTSISPGRYTKYDETLLVFGTHPKLSYENNIANSALEHIVEANTLLRGLGFESGGLADGRR